MEDNILEMRNITKIYDNGFVANDQVNFSVRKGEIHGLVGENGAGKTTLMKVLFGQEIPEKGEIFIAGEKTRMKSPLDALEKGIGMVHQHFMLVNNLSVMDNMVLGNEPHKGIFYDRTAARKQVLEVAKCFDLPVDPEMIVENLSVGMKQRVEILKILLKGATLLLLDEPTAVLTPQETKQLFRQLKGLKEKGFSIVFISHKLNEVKEICDRVTVLRAGRSITTQEVKDLSEQDISKLMVGHEVKVSHNDRNQIPGKIMLRVRGLTHIGETGKDILKNLNFDVREGEILGIAGVEGNGQSEFSEILAGLLPLQEGEISVNGQSLKQAKNIREIRDFGVSCIHEDRMHYGVSSQMSIMDNILADRYFRKEYRKNGFLNKAKQKEEVSRLREEFRIKCEDISSPVRTLSGGNIQKVVAAREFTSHPRFLLACHPTRGIDIGAAEMIREKMLKLRDEERTAILLLSADFAELLEISDRILVFYEGEVVACFPDSAAVDETTLGEYMLGIKRQNDEEIRRACYEDEED